MFENVSNEILGYCLSELFEYIHTECIGCFLVGTNNRVYKGIDFDIEEDDIKKMLVYIIRAEAYGWGPPT